MKPSASFSLLVMISLYISLSKAQDNMSGPCTAIAGSINEFQLEDLDGKLNALKERFKSDRCGLEIVGFPCNQFKLHEPGDTATEIRNCVKYVRPGGGFEPNFPLMKKTEVNGIKEHPLYTFLKTSCPSPDGVIREDRYKDVRVLWSPIKSDDISWNFEKFLIDHRGKPVRRYKPRLFPERMVQDIDSVINCCKSAAYCQKEGL
ncbi:predicted protein [Nematostella vectensis]|uniref:Glutathione peroxidase n=1 Tax=Nematostella vectensis TaxID=45351 RepID=A7RH41_NEMVE|nr:predicted protein [Nematostella vectensis]|eukprot:XP_001641219.1 predicted protein [Nematostella vectensis]